MKEKKLKKVTFHEIPSNVMLSYYLTSVLTSLPLIFSLLFLLFLVQNRIYLDQFLLYLLFVGAVLLSVLLYYFGYYHPLTMWAVDNVRCPKCNGKIKNCVWKHKFWVWWVPKNICEVQCGNCNRKFLFDKVANLLVLNKD
jgi:hypothetical protein